MVNILRRVSGSRDGACEAERDLVVRRSVLGWTSGRDGGGTPTPTCSNGPKMYLFSHDEKYTAFGNVFSLADISTTKVFVAPENRTSLSAGRSTSQHGSTTEVHASDTSALVTRIVRKEILADTVRFPGFRGGISLRIRKWLKRTVLDSVAYALQAVDGAYFLRNYHVYRLALYAPDATTIIAHWNLQTDSSPLTLVISSGLSCSYAQIIVAFLYAEQKTRILGIQTVTSVQISQFSTLLVGLRA
ncbi:hypothetical protein K438DRAFT_1769542 [Mycena galopus ATCC 62051]|nr:hypothetical protein K438DRAFT_1769542 [Mycena galopus ATCC 62051]